MRTALPNNRGVTLVEVMISMVILLIVFMGLIQASLLTINHNMRNEVRDEAVRVGAASIALLRSFNYSCEELNATSTGQLVTGGTACTNTLTTPQITEINCPQRSFRNITLQGVSPCTGGYKVTKGVDWLDNNVPQPNTKRLRVMVEWKYPGETDLQSHIIYYTMRNPVQ